MGQVFWQVDAFAEEPFAGNPAGVMLLDQPAEPGFMQSFAAEMNLSETAYLWPESGSYRLRWFTPAAEVALCGHATLATCHVLYSQGMLPPGAPVVFMTQSGELRARRLADGRIELDFPANPPEEAPAPQGLAEALGAKPLLVAKSRFDYLALLADAATVRGLAPNSLALKSVEARGVMVTAAGDRPGVDFVSRFFAPRVGIDEDPVTGSAHCALTPFWAARLGKKEMNAYQASRRGGFLGVRLGDKRVYLAGRAVTVFKGELA